MRLYRLMAPMAAAALLLSACSGSGATPAPTAAPTAAPSAAPSAAGGGEKAVGIKDFAFNPSETSTSVGGKITWTNADDAPHTVTFNDASITSSGNLTKGQAFTATFAAAGEYAYKCSIHPSMTGKITVT